MVHLRLRHTDNPAALDAQPPAQVDLLVVGEETPVETVHVPVVLTTDHQRSTCRPEHVSQRVVLSVVGLHRLKHPTATEGIAVGVEVSPTRPGIFKLVFVED